MPVVPTVNVQQQAPIFQTGRGASAEAFGAGVARAQGQFGQAVDNTTQVATDIVNQLQVEDNEREAKELDAEFTRRKRAILNDYYQRQGTNAINAAPTTKNALNVLRAEMQGNASNQVVADTFGDVTLSRVEADVSNIDRHTIKERQVANQAASEARVDTVISEAALNPFNPEFLEESEKAIAEEIFSQAEQQGWSNDVFKAETVNEVSRMWETTIGLAIESDVNGAAELYFNNQQKMNGVTQIKIESAIVGKRRQNIIDSERQERINDKRMKDFQDENFSEMTVRTANLEMTENELIGALSRDEITPAQFRNLLNFSRDEVEENGDPNVANELELLIRNNLADSTDIMDNAQLSSDEKQRLIGIWDTTRRQGGILSGALVKQHQTRVDDIVGGGRDLFGRLSGITAVERTARAVQEYQDRVLSGEDPRAVADNVIERFRPQPQTLESLGVSDFWPVNGPGALQGTRPELFERVVISRGRAAQAFGEGRINQSQFSLEMERMNRYQAAIEDMPDSLITRTDKEQ